MAQLVDGGGLVNRILTDASVRIRFPAHIALVTQELEYHSFKVGVVLAECTGGTICTRGAIGSAIDS